MIEIAILGLLKESDLHGYELRRRLREELGTIITVSFGSLYPTLARLKSKGALEELEPQKIGTPVPSAGSLSGERALFRASGGFGAERRTTRSRKVYRITKRGEEMLEELLATTEAQFPEGSDGKSFAVKLAFSRYLPPPARMSLLRHRRDDLKRRLDEAKKATCNNSEIYQYRKALAERTYHLIETDLQWLNQLITKEEQSSSGLLTEKNSNPSSANNLSSNSIQLPTTEVLKP